MVVTGFGTTLNGKISAFVFDSVDCIYADLKGGDDILGISRSELPFDSVLSALATASRYGQGSDVIRCLLQRVGSSISYLRAERTRSLSMQPNAEGGRPIMEVGKYDQPYSTSTSIAKVQSKVPIASQAPSKVMSIRPIADSFADKPMKSDGTIIPMTHFA